VEFIATGSELLIGRSLNTHVRRLAEALVPLGLQVARETTLPDDRSAIAAELRAALVRSQVVLVSGGLGPTCDDVTREAAADALGCALVEDAATLDRLRVRYLASGHELTPGRRRQALVLEGAAVLVNRVGSAPGQRADLEGGRVLFLLPGPPAEFQAMLEDHVTPWLRRHAGGLAPIVHVWMVCGLVEGEIIERLKEVGFDPGPLELAYCASPGQLEVRLTAPPDHKAGMARAADLVRAALGEHAYSETREDLAAVVGRMLQHRGMTVAVAESCTGGLIGQKITSVPGSSAWFRGGVVAYANDLKTRLLEVPGELLAAHGAVSEPVARAMAEGARRRLDADFGISTTGVAGPDGGTPDKPVGLVWWAVADREGSRALSRRFFGDRATIREWAAQMALDALRRRLIR